MVERFAISVGVAVVAMGAFFAIPRVIGSNGQQGSIAASDEWPDILAGLDSIVESWLGMNKYLDYVIGLIGVGLLGLSAGAYRDPTLLGGLAEHVDVVAVALAAAGFLGLFIGSYTSLRRSRVSRAEATFIGLCLVGASLMILITVMLLES